MKFLEGLQIALIVLKLWGVIGWSWWLVCIPIIASFALSTVLGIVKGILEARKPENIAKRLFGQGI